LGTSVSSIIDVTTSPLGVLPGPATGLTISSVSATALIISWTPSLTGSPPFQFEVQRRIAGSGAAFAVVTALTTNTSQQVTGLTPNTSYEFQVVTLNATGNTASASALATTSALPPGAVTGLALSGNPGPTSVSLTWQAPSTGSAPFTYQVYMASPSGSGVYSPVGGTQSGTTATISGLTSGLTYDFYVQASNSAGTGVASTPLSNVRTATGAVLPSAPLNLAAGTVTSTSIALSWSPPAVGTPPLSYVVQYRLSAS
jgi:chitodextrinase